MPSAPPNSPASKTTLSRGEAWPGIAVPGSPGVGGRPVVLGEDERREVHLVGELDQPVQGRDPGVEHVVHGSTSATVARPPVSDLSSLCCLPDEPRKMRGLSMVRAILGPSDWRCGDLPHAGRALRRPAGLPLAAVVRRGGGRRRRHAADGVRRRRSRRRTGRAAAARRAVVVVPLPARDPGPHRRRHPVRGARHGRVRAVGQAARTGGPHLRPPRRVDARAGPGPPRPARRDPVRSGLGRAARAAAGGRAPRPVRARRGRQHRPPDRRLRHAGDLVDVPQRGREGRGARHRPAGRRRLRARA